MRLPLHRVNAFTGPGLAGNPAAVVTATGPLLAARMQVVAAELKLSETAFTWPLDAATHQLHWFTPSCEARLCGHATLATAAVLLGAAQQEIRFCTASGMLQVQRQGEQLALSLPAQPLGPVAPPLAAPVVARGWFGDSLLVALLGSAAAVRDYQPDWPAIRALHPQVLVLTAAGEDCDFVYRYFAPGYGVPEDPVTGSACCALGPFWAQRLGRATLVARQLSARGGALSLQVGAQGVTVAGHCQRRFSGELRLS